MANNVQHLLAVLDDIAAKLRECEAIKTEFEVYKVKKQASFDNLKNMHKAEIQQIQQMQKDAEENVERIQSERNAGTAEIATLKSRMDSLLAQNAFVLGKNRELSDQYEKLSRTLTTSVLGQQVEEDEDSLFVPEGPKTATPDTPTSKRDALEHDGWDADSPAAKKTKRSEGVSSNAIAQGIGNTNAYTRALQTRDTADIIAAVHEHYENIGKYSDAKRLLNEQGDMFKPGAVIEFWSDARHGHMVPHPIEGDRGMKRLLRNTVGLKPMISKPHVIIEDAKGNGPIPAMAKVSCHVTVGMSEKMWKNQPRPLP